MEIKRVKVLKIVALIATIVVIILAFVVYFENKSHSFEQTQTNTKTTSTIAIEDDPHVTIQSDDKELIKFEEDGLYGFKRNGKVVITAKYDAAISFSNGLAAVEDYENGKWGFIDKTGNQVFQNKVIQLVNHSHA